MRPAEALRADAKAHHHAVVQLGTAAADASAAFSKKLKNHAAAVSLYVAHYNLCRVHEALTPNAKHQPTPAMALGLTAHPWSIGELLGAALAVAPADPTTTAPDRRRRFWVIDGGREG